MSTAKTICAEFELSLIQLKDQFIKFPLTRQQLQELMDEFEEEYRVPQIVGPIEGCHIDTNAPQITTRTSSIESSITVSIYRP